jgi:DNA-binding LytR/AlgR family response regulator
MDKPIKVAELSAVLDEIIRNKKENYIPTIELRNQYETFYVEAKNILYFVGNGYSVDVHMTDGTIRQATSFVDSLWRDLYSFPTFQIINPTTIINTAYIAGLGPLSVMMRDSTKHTVKTKYFAVIKKKLSKYRG